VRRAFAFGVGLLIAAAAAADEATLADVLRTNGLTPPAGLPDLDRSLASHAVSNEGGRVTVIYDAGSAGSARLVALRVGPGPHTITRAPLAWPRSATVDAATCARVDSVRERATIVLVTAHINPSASCTLVLDQRLALKAVLAGWPMVDLPNGPFVYQRNQIHFAAVHPLALHLFDPARLTDTRIYPRKPYQPIRAAHIAKMQRVYTDAWCATHNHPCDPDVFDEQLTGDVLVDRTGNALAFSVAFDNTSGWSDAERWGRLEPFRELRAAMSTWDGQASPPDALPRALAAGLGRARNLGAQAHVADALAGDPELRDMVAGVLAGSRPAGVDEARWLAALDTRWSDPAIWRRLRSAVETPDEFTEVVYVYTGLHAPARLRYHEFLRQDFETRFGSGSLGPALEPAALTAIFGPGPR
jgi:hypothetical protein